MSILIVFKDNPEYSGQVMQSAILIGFCVTRLQRFYNELIVKNKISKTFRNALLIYILS